MATEIERKFLITGDGWRDNVVRSRSIEQAYLADSAIATLRVRVTDGAEAVVTIKSNRKGAARDEFEYEIPIDDAHELLDLGKARSLSKQRHIVEAGDDLIWEIDIFEAGLEGLAIAEIELDHEDQIFDRPDWLGEEVTQDERYYNARLARDGHPR